MALDFRAAAGARGAFRRLLAHADIVIESSRPRALRQLGIVGRAMGGEPGRRGTWVGITGYGREEPFGNWIAFGDDAGVAAGLADLMRAATGAYQFAGDAVADPLAGARAAATAWRSWLSGGSRLVSLSLAGTAAHMLSEEVARLGVEGAIRTAGEWWRAARRGRGAAGIVRRRITAITPACGADTAAVLRRAAFTNCACTRD